MSPTTTDSADTEPNAPAGTHSEPSQRSANALPGQLAGRSLPRQVLALAAWPWLEQLMAFSVGTVDLALAGHLGTDQQTIAATDALGTTTYVTWLMSMIHSGVGVGSVALVARAIGGRHRGLANAALGQSLLMACISGLTVGAAIYILAPVIGALAGLNGQSLDLSVLYLRVVTLAAPASALLLVGGACLRGAGDTRTPFLVMLLVNMVNVTASILFVYGPGPIGGHGVAGIAAGTVTAWLVGMTLMLTALYRGWGGIRLHLHRLRPHAHTIRRITRLAIPNLLESIGGMWAANFLVLMIVGRIDSSGVIGAHMIAIRVESLSFLSGFAFGIAAATLTGQYLGAGNPRRARQAALVCWAFAATFMTLLGVILTIWPQLLARVITDDPLLIEMATDPIRISGPIQIFFATKLIAAGALRGAGDTRAAMWLTTGSTFLVRLPAVYVVGVVFDLGLTGVWFALCGELIFRGVIFGARFLHGGWAKVQV